MLLLAAATLAIGGCDGTLPGLRGELVQLVVDNARPERAEIVVDAPPADAATVSIPGCHRMAIPVPRREAWTLAIGADVVDGAALSDDLFGDVTVTLRLLPEGTFAAPEVVEGMSRVLEGPIPCATG